MGASRCWQCSGSFCYLYGCVHFMKISWAVHLRFMHFLYVRCSLQSLSRVWLFATPWTAAHQASLSITNSWSLLKLMSITSVMPSNHLTSVVPFSSHLQSFPASWSFLMSQFFESGGQRIGVSTSASVLPINIQEWFPLGWIGWISLQSKGLLQHHSSKALILQCSAFFIVQLSHPYDY